MYQLKNFGSEQQLVNVPARPVPVLPTDQFNSEEQPNRQQRFTERVQRMSHFEGAKPERKLNFRVSRTSFQFS